MSLKKLGFETIIVNCNPETVSTDYDRYPTNWALNPTLEDVLSIYYKEKPVASSPSSASQTPPRAPGGQKLKEEGVNILGTTPEVIDLAEDGTSSCKVMDKLGIPMAESGMASTVRNRPLNWPTASAYPVMVRPSLFVLGGRGMEVVHDDEQMKDYMAAAIGVTSRTGPSPHLTGSCTTRWNVKRTPSLTARTAFVPAVLEHIELAGIHSGDSACILPSRQISKKI